jgi:hypothetical protein
MMRTISLLLLLPCAACSQADDPDTTPASSERGRAEVASSESSDPTVGGSTEDFTGDMEVCQTTSLFELDAATPLGPSGAEVLSHAEGRFEVPIRWMSICQQQGLPCSVSTFCAADDPARPMSAFAGTETLVSVEIQAQGDPVRVIHRTPGDEQCAQSMSVPVTLSVRTADGALDETVVTELGSDGGDGTESTLGFSRAVSQLQGALARDASLSADASFDMVFGFYGSKVWMEMDAIQPGNETDLPVPLLSDLLPPFDTCALDIPRADVER